MILRFKKKEAVHLMEAIRSNEMYTLKRELTFIKNAGKWDAAVNKKNLGG